MKLVAWIPQSRYILLCLLFLWFSGFSFRTQKNSTPIMISPTSRWGHYFYSWNGTWGYARRPKTQTPHQTNKQTHEMEIALMKWNMGYVIRPKSPYPRSNKQTNKQTICFFKISKKLQCLLWRIPQVDEGMLWDCTHQTNN